ncbi:MAG TPA: hypothetical protein DCP91_10680 [Eggerthellaceae bacterium]|nr:hypothetical protein [Eggerthellaceae bacterium]
MTNSRPIFEKKEMAISASPYVYLPMDIPLYVVEYTHEDEVDADLLQKALDRTLARMPYLADTLQIEGGAVYYAENPLPMEVGRGVWLRPVGGRETNYHMLDLTCNGKTTCFSMYHGFCDGQGINMFAESVLYHYYCMRDGKEYDPCGIRTDAGAMPEAEEFEPCSVTRKVTPGFEMPERQPQEAPYHLPEITPTAGAEVSDWGLRVDSGSLMSFVKVNGTSPAVAISMLVAEAVAAVHPDADAPIFANLPVSVRRMLGCEETFKNCSSRIILPISGTPLDALPFAERAAQLRGILKQQMNPDVYRSVYNMLRAMYSKRMQEATDYWEETKKPSGFAMVTHDTFYIDYIGRLHETGYSSSITDVRFLCKPPAGNTLQVNVIDHGGQFRIDCLARCDVTAIVDALEQAFANHGLAVERKPEDHFTLPYAVWREGVPGAE